MRVGLSVTTPPLLVAMAWGTYTVATPAMVPAFLAILAAALGYVVLFDIPLSIDIAEQGIHRNCVLRRQLLEWDDLVGITKLRRRGLTAVTRSGKKVILIDRALDDSERDLIETEARLRDVKTVL